MLNKNRIQKIKLTTPIFVAPMAGGPSTAELAGGASEAGALGCIGGAYLNPHDLAEAISAVQKITKKPFAVNLFVPHTPTPFTDEEKAAALAATNSYRQELGISENTLQPPYHENFEEQFAVVLQLKPAVFSFIFGSIGKEKIKACRKNGIATLGTATSLEEALILQEDGVDGIIAQGNEAGGHRGYFNANQNEHGLPLRDLLQELSGKIKLPIVAAGGIMTGTEIAEMQNLGADYVQMGTAFLACPEAGTHAAFKKVLGNHSHKQTELTRAFTGRWARGIQNRFIIEMKNSRAILPFPVQNKLTRDIRNASAKIQSAELMSLWAGTEVDRIRAALPVRQLIEILEEERKSQLN